MLCYTYELCVLFFFFFKQKTAYEIYQCDWSSDVCSSDLSRATGLEVVDRLTCSDSIHGTVAPDFEIESESSSRKADWNLR